MADWKLFQFNSMNERSKGTKERLYAEKKGRERPWDHEGGTRQLKSRKKQKGTEYSKKPSAAPFLPPQEESEAKVTNTR
jgi:hypothetical protein